MQRFTGGDVRDTGGVVSGARCQRAVVGGPLKIEYTVFVDIVIDPLRVYSRENIAHVRGLG
jgi:hypothetical protein